MLSEYDEMLIEVYIKNNVNHPIGRKLRLRELAVREDIDKHPSKYMNRVMPVSIEGGDIFWKRYKSKKNTGRKIIEYLVKNKWYTMLELEKKFGINQGIIYKKLAEGYTIDEIIFGNLCEQNKVLKPII